MIKRFKKFDLTLILTIIILIQPIITQITAIITRKNIPIPSIGLFYNFLLIIFSIIYIIFFSKSKYKKISIYILLSIFIYCLLFFSIKIINDSIYDTIKECKVFIKYLYFPIVTLGFINTIDTKNSNKIIDLLKICLLIYDVLILSALLTGTAFPSYDNSYVGKIGWFYSTNEISAMFAILIPISIINFKKNIFNIIVIIFSVICILFIGTKTSFLGLFLLILVVLIYIFVKSKLKYKIIILLILVTISALLIFIKPPTMVNFVKSVNNYISNKNNTSLNQNSYGSISFLVLSERNVFFTYGLYDYKNVSIIQKIIGAGFMRHGASRHLVEMDFFDLLFRYGIIGLIALSLHIFYVIYRIINHKIKKYKSDFNLYILKYSFIIAVGISFAVGHVFGSPAVSFFFAIIIAILLNTLDKMEVNNE